MVIHMNKYNRILPSKLLTFFVFASIMFCAPIQSTWADPNPKAESKAIPEKAVPVKKPPKKTAFKSDNNIDSKYKPTKFYQSCATQEDEDRCLIKALNMAKEYNEFIQLVKIKTGGKDNLESEDLEWLVVYLINPDIFECAGSALFELKAGDLVEIRERGSKFQHASISPSQRLSVLKELNANYHFLAHDDDAISWLLASWLLASNSENITKYIFSETIKFDLESGDDIDEIIEFAIDLLSQGEFSKDLNQYIIKQLQLPIHWRDPLNNDTILHKEMPANVIEIFISAGADVNAKNNDGNTPLHLVDNVNAANVLIKAGTKLNEENNDGNTPMDIAINCGNDSLYKALKKAGGKYKNQVGRTLSEIERELKENHDNKDKFTDRRRMLENPNLFHDFCGVKISTIH